MPGLQPIFYFMHQQLFWESSNMKSHRVALASSTKQQDLLHGIAMIFIRLSHAVCRQQSSLGSRRARSMSPERRHSDGGGRGYGSDSEALSSGAVVGRSRSFLHPAPDPMADSYGDIYSPLRSGIRPGSFTFTSLNELGKTLVSESAARLPQGFSCVLGLGSISCCHVKERIFLNACMDCLREPHTQHTAALHLPHS